jgi:hypothetical protein
VPARIGTVSTAGLDTKEILAADAGVDESQQLLGEICYYWLNHVDLVKHQVAILAAHPPGDQSLDTIRRAAVKSLSTFE